MEEGLDPKGLGEVLGKLAEGKATDAAAVLTNVLVTAATFPLLGPSSIGVGRVTEGATRAIAARVSDSAIRRMLRAGEELDASRAADAALAKAIHDALAEIEQSQQD